MSVGGAVDVGLELGQQARHQVDRARELGDFLEVKGHAQIIFGRMQTAPTAWDFRPRHRRGNRADAGATECEGNRCHHLPFNPVVETLYTFRRSRALRGLPAGVRARPPYKLQACHRQCRRRPQSDSPQHWG